ncbi:DEAD/DEAH box helicase [Knoellia sp. 3-2P3]|uniref:DEAD/DEAH box helicase n=1 Tax=unclassified Knoellia TaxID=2618719 RepID=UPI0023DC9E58|nr:DEAD/DEAH box helicase [Knoellia sp. 3-2P3]MDF2092587.1 DEAD/DEAH box helicase [Knoellia sp. 3-2P3]
MDSRYGAQAKELVAWASQFRAEADAALQAVAALDDELTEVVQRLGAETLARDGAETHPGRVARFDLAPTSPASAELVAALRRRERVATAHRTAIDLAQRVSADLTALEKQGSSGRGRLRMRLAGSEKRREVTESLARLDAYRTWADDHRVGAQFAAVCQAADRYVASDREDFWSDITRRSQWCADRIAATRGFVGRVLASDDLRRASTLAVHLPAVAEATDKARTRVRVRFEAVRKGMIRADLEQMPIARVKDVTGGRLRLGVLEKSGYPTIQSVLDSTPSQLIHVEGVGEQTAKQVYAAAQQLAKAVEDDFRFRINLDPGDRMITELVMGLCEWERVHRLTLGLDDDELNRIAASLPSLRGIRPPQGGLSVVLANAEGSALADSVLRAVVWASQSGRWERIESAAAVLSAPAVTPDEAWSDFAKRSADYYTLLGTLVDLNLDEEAEVGFLPAEIVEKVHAQPLDDAHRRVSLRGYQSFGARFALVQKRVIIGDEMGLGKTIQALAVLAHLKSIDAPGRLLVVCPASVLVNWTREITERSTLRVHKIHGPERAWAFKRWKQYGDVGVTTFETLRSLSTETLDFAMVVVDEAHFLKNPATQRSRNVLRLLARSDRALFLTGTPMENRVDEFRTLVTFLQPWLVDGLTERSYVAPERFRQLIAPAYLRRNQEDVLAELPELVVTDEWEEFTAEDSAAYRQAVAEGNFMAMRRAAFADPRKSAKMARLKEIVAEAGENGHKTIVFSYFRDVLEGIRAELDGRAFGPLTGSLAATKRQELVDAFSRANSNAVLLSQIQAGGVGLNMQAGSVVVICEPQVKPTLEAQAIARAHRMGQVRSVQVHRLLTAESIDQRMVEMLDSKQALFDEYARRSDIASASPEALDISEAALAKTIVEREQERLAMKALAEFQADHGAEGAGA